MMRHMRMIGLTIVTVLTFAVVASASAVAAENPVLSASPVTTKGTDAEESFWQSTATGGPKVECETEASASTLTTTTAGTGKTSGTATVTLKGCKSAAGKCTNTSASNEITGTVALLLVWVGKESEEKPGILVGIGAYKGGPRGTNPLLSFKCSGRLDDFEGSYIALTNRKLGEQFTTTDVISKQNAGVQEDQKFTENGVEGTNSEFSNAGNGWFQTAWEVTRQEAYSTEVEIKKN